MNDADWFLVFLGTFAAFAISINNYVGLLL